MRRERCVWPADQVGQYGNERDVLTGQFDGLRAGRVDGPDSIVREIRACMMRA